LEGLAMEDVGILGPFCLFTGANGLFLWPIGTFCGHLVCFSRFGMFYREKSGNPALHYTTCITLKQDTRNISDVMNKFYNSLLKS
jgi:hypothetical protein